MSTNELQETFSELKDTFKAYEKVLKIISDKSETYNLNAGYSKKYKRNMYFGGVEIKKNYVSFYLMPVYVNPKLLEGISPELKKRMLGKSSGNPL